MRRGIVIVGAGHAAGRAAAALRKQGWAGSIVLVGEEVDPPYERPPLSKSVLAESADPLIHRIGDDAFYRDNAIELCLGTRTDAIDPRRRRVELAGGGQLSYERLILTTGARPRTISCPGAGLDGVVTLRTAADARRLAPLLRRGTDVAVIGGGLIGLEVASSATTRGAQVNVIEAAPHLLPRMLGPEVAAHVARLHRSHGVGLHIGAEVEAIEGDGRVRAVRLKDGTRLPAETVVVGIGAVPNLELAEAAGLDCGDGVLVDGFARSSAPEIYAAGDVANHFNPWLGRRLRLESWDNAESQSQAAAKAICGRPEPYGGVPWFWTDQFDMNLQILGLNEPCERTVVRGDPETGSFSVFHLANGRIIAAALVNSGRERRPVKALMEQRLTVSPELLADASTPLRDLARPG